MATYDGAAYRLMLLPDENYDEFIGIEGETTSSLNITCDALEVTNKASAWKQYIAGDRGATINATLYASDDDKQQKDALDGLVKGQKVYLVLFKPVAGSTGNTEIEYHAEAIITSIGFTASSGAVATRDIALQITGELLYFES